MKEILTEVSNLSESDCLRVAERSKTCFDYPLHRHKECEFNFVYNAPGVRRVVGDSVETIGDLDLVLVSGENLEHVWEQGECKSSNIREITIHFSQDFLGANIAGKNQFHTINKMLMSAKYGISFPREAIMRVYNILDTFTSQTDSFMQLLDFLKMCYILSLSKYRVLASSSFACQDTRSESERIMKVRKFVADHFDSEISLKDVADVAGMSQTAFTRYFKAATGDTFVSYLTGIRLGFAQRLLVNTEDNIKEICYKSGFSNLSNFNRVFRQKRGMTPKEFRHIYKKNKIII